MRMRLVSRTINMAGQAAASVMETPCKKRKQQQNDSKNDNKKFNCSDEMIIYLLEALKSYKVLCEYSYVGITLWFGDSISGAMYGESSSVS